MNGVYAGNAGAISCLIKDFITTKNLAYPLALRELSTDASAALQ